MRKTVLKLIILTGTVVSCLQLFATTGELRTPLERFPFHYPLLPVQIEKDDGQEYDWSINCFKSAYMRSADSGYDKCHGRKIVPLAQLFFGKASFKAQDVFFNSQVDSRACPELKYVIFKPRFKYRERGCNIGFEGEYRCQESKWRFGGSVSLPYKVIELERNVCSATMTSQDGDSNGGNGGLDLTNLVCTKDETLYRANGTTLGVEAPATVPAYRLDFLAGLRRGPNLPMVEFGDGSVRIGGIEVAYEPSTGDFTYFAVIQSDDSTCPSNETFATPNQATPKVANAIGDLLANHFVQANGAVQIPGGSDNRGAFVTSQNYAGAGNLANDSTAQSKLYIVPVYDSNMQVASNTTAGEATRFYDQAVIAMNAIEEAIDDLSEGGVNTVEQFFFNNGVHFCQVPDGCHSARNMGVGDLELDFYAAWGNIEEYWGKFIVGVVFPTGRKICNPGLLLSQPTGNNGHFEFKAALEGGWLIRKRLGIHGDISYNHVFEATEYRGAPFKGATVKNIGPKIQAKTKWGYFTGHLDLSLFHSRNADLGCCAGYEFYYKRCDCIKLCSCMAKEFPLREGCATTGTILNDELKELDCSILAKDTKRISHKIRCEVFHRWDFCELYGGASYVFAGKNIMQETEAHLGIGIYW